MVVFGAGSSGARRPTAGSIAGVLGAYLALFPAADSLGGLPALRLIGCVAAGVTVLGGDKQVGTMGSTGAATNATGQRA